MTLAAHSSSSASAGSSPRSTDMLIVDIPGCTFGELAAQLRARRSFIEAVRREAPRLHRAWRRLYARVRPTLEHSPLRAQDAQTSLAPVTLPAALKLALPCDASLLILELLAGTHWRARASAVFARSHWQPAARQFQTVERGGLPCIWGSDGRRFGHLIAIAHELGHCLFEERYGWRRTRDVFRSEASAAILEDALVRAALPTLGQELQLRASWHEYLQRSDGVTERFCELEACDVMAGAKEAALPGELAWSRPSYLTRVGMQWVYGFAAAKRRALSAELQRASCADVLDAIIQGGAV